MADERIRPLPFGFRDQSTKAPLRLSASSPQNRHRLGARLRRTDHEFSVDMHARNDRQARILSRGKLEVMSHGVPILPKTCRT